MAHRGLWSRRTLLAAGGCLLSAGLGPPSIGSAQTLRYFRIATGGTGGTYFPVGGMIANAVSTPPGIEPCARGNACGVPGLIAVAQASAGSVDNVELIRTGAMESGFCQADIALWAHTGTMIYRETGPMPELAAIANLYFEVIHIVVGADDEIATIDDLRGRRIGLGPVGSGTRIDAELILLAHGLTEADYDPIYAPIADAADALADRAIDAFFFVAGTPTLIVADLAERTTIRLLSIDPQVGETLARAYPFFRPAAILPTTYRNVGLVSTVGVGALWAVSTAVDPDDVYGVTRALWHDNARPLLDNGHPKGRSITLATALEGITIPLHSGAARYYREHGHFD